MSDFIKKEITFFVLENKDNFTLEEFIKLIYKEFPRYEELGFALTIYYQYTYPEQSLIGELAAVKNN